MRLWTRSMKTGRSVLNRVIEPPREERFFEWDGGVTHVTRLPRNRTFPVGCALAARSFLRAITAGCCFTWNHPLAVDVHTHTHTHRAAHTLEWSSTRTRGRGTLGFDGGSGSRTCTAAPRRVVSGIEISGFGNSRCTRLPRRTVAPTRRRPDDLNSVN